MGGLFSSKPTPPPTWQTTEFHPYSWNRDDPGYLRTPVVSRPPTPAPQSYYRCVQPTTSQPTQPTTSRPTQPTTSRPTQPTTSLTQTPSRPRVSRFPLMPSVCDQAEASAWSLDPMPQGASFRLVNVPEWNEDYATVEDAFKSTTQKHFKVIKVERIENPFLLGCYLLKKTEMKQRYGNVMEMMNFHGTKMSNVGPICENNFNWRLHGDSIGNRFGQGVSFSPISYYASHYSDKKASIKVMLYAKVLVSNMVVGDGNMVLPPKMSSNTNLRFDSSGKQNGHVIVKFSDDEFYPEFVIHYSNRCSKS